MSLLIGVLVIFSIIGFISTNNATNYMFGVATIVNVLTYYSVEHFAETKAVNIDIIVLFIIVKIFSFIIISSKHRARTDG